jgi:hypothetical protein
MATTISFKYNNKMPCSNCGISGHNKRTCGGNEVVGLKVGLQPVVGLEPVVGLQPVVALNPTVEDCFVCYENVSERGQVKTPCGHTYCIGCFVQHTQINKATNCGYCRTKLELPRKPSSISISKRTEIINKCISDYDMYEAIYTDFYRQMRLAIHCHPTLANSAVQATEMCKEVLKDISLDFGLWMIGMKVSDAVIEELA